MKLPNFLRRKVAVTFIDVENSATIARSDVPLEQLPDTFEIQTDLELQGEKYFVVRAEPATKDEFSKTRQLAVSVRRTNAVDLSQILYSLPSICGSALPPSRPTRVAGDVHVLHEDDWRQCEFVDIDHAALITRELAAIRRIHEVASTAVGWREIHVRGLIDSPLPHGINWSKVRELLGSAADIGGVAFGDASRPVEHARAARFEDGVVVWGVESTTGLSVLCVENVADATRESSTALTRISDSLSLACVRWARVGRTCQGART